MLLQHRSARLRKNAAPPYQRSRSHFLWYIGIDALLSISLVVGVFQFTESRLGDGRHEIELEHAGAIAMTPTQIIDHLRHEGRRAYWLGPQVGAKYATDDMAPHQLTITYLPRGADLYAPNEPKMTIQTFDGSESFQKVRHVYRNSETTKRVVTAGGNTVVFDPKDMKSEIVSRQDSPMIVVINYTYELNQNGLLSKADSLIPIQ